MAQQVETNHELAALMSRGAFIFNDFSGPRSGRGNLLHAPACPHLRAANVSVDKWAFDSVADAEAWLSDNRGPEGVGWARCAFCLGGSRTPIGTSPAPAVARAVAPLPTREDLAVAMSVYRQARRAFLAALGIPRSNRDPLAEFAERLVAAAIGGRLADSPVQKGYDVLDGSNRRIQVKYVANPKNQWINGHTIKFDEGVDGYALVLVEDLEPVGLLYIARETLAGVCARLGKRHPDQERTLQVTRSNVLSLLDSPTAFSDLGVRVARAPGWELEPAPFG